MVVIILQPATAQEGFKLRTVVIDAGHGGKDPGAIGYSGLREKDVALNVSLLVGKYITENFPNVKVVYTRDKDVFIPLFERGKIARDVDADLFISIHANSFSKSTVRGTEVFVLGLHKSETSLALAKKENASIFMEDNYQENYDYDPNDPETHIKMAMGINANIGQSISMAQNIDDQFVSRVHRSSRGVKQAGFIVLHQNTCPSVLVELGFLSNPTEEAYLKTKNGQDYLASAIYRAFKDYKREVENYVPSESGQEVFTTPAPVKKEKPAPKAAPVVKEPIAVATSTGVVYKVQFMATDKLYVVGDEALSGIDDFSTEKVGKTTHRYLTGNCTTWIHAQELQATIRKKGMTGAFVVAYKNGKRITVAQAKTLTEK